MQRVASVEPKIDKIPHLRLAGFPVEGIKPARPAHYDLARDNTRTVAFVVDYDLHPELHEKLYRMAGPWP